MLIRRIPRDKDFNSLDFSSELNVIDIKKKLTSNLRCGDLLSDITGKTIISENGHRLLIDVIELSIPLTILNGKKYLEVLNQKYVHFYTDNQFVRLLIHAEWDIDQGKHILRVLSALVFMSLFDVFDDVFRHRIWTYYTFQYNRPDLVNYDRFPSLLLKFVPLRKVEITMDFKKYKLVDYFDTNHLILVNGSTLYTKDYSELIRKSGPRAGEIKETKKSFISIYDWSKKNDSEEMVTRLEFRFLSRYIHHFQQSSLALNTEDLFDANLKFIEKKTQSLIPKGALRFNGVLMACGPRWFRKFLEATYGTR